MEENKSDAVIPPEVTENNQNEKKKSKYISDARTFLIAFLTSLIVVLAYHGIISMLQCSKKSCFAENRIYRCDSHVFPRHHKKKINKNFRRPPCMDENCKKSGHPHHKRMKFNRVSEKQADQKNDQSPVQQKQDK